MLRLSILPLAGFLALIMLSHSAERAATINVTVCTFDSSDSAILNGSTVEVREGSNPVSAGQTSDNGCVDLQVEVTSTVGVDDDLPGFLSLSVDPAFPNPFEETVRVPFANDRSQSVTASLFDLLGRRVSESTYSSMAPGQYNLTISGAGLPQGVYVYRIAGADEAVSGQLVKLGNGQAGGVEMTVEPAGAFGKSASTAASTVTVTTARLGYNPVEELHEVEDGATINMFMTKQETSSDFEFITTSLQVSFTNHSTGADTFDWDFGDGSSSDEENPIHLYNTEGEYDVVLVASLQGVADTTMKMISVSATPGTNAMIPLDRTDLYSPGDNYMGEAYAWPNDPSPVPVGSVIIGTGYSNASQHFNTFDSQYQSLMNPEFINCGVGSNAIENWIGQNTEMLFNDCIAEVEAAGYTADDVALTMNLIANQVLYPPFPEPGNGVDTLETQVQILGSLLEQYFPNAINMYTTGEPAHWVELSKCPRICEPIRYETGFGVNRALAKMDPDKHIHGAYLWSALDIPNASGETWVIEDFLNPTGDGFANQHPSNDGRAKASRIYHAFLSEKYPTWYPK